MSETEPIPSPSADEAGPTASLELPLHPGAAGGRPRRAGLRRRRLVPVAAALAGVVAALAIAGVLVHRRQRVAEGITRATALVRLDTAAGYAEAAAVLAPLADVDRLEAGSLRAFALAMRVLDYGDAAAEVEAERLLVAPSRAAEVPAYADLALAALAIARREAGTATTAATHAAGNPWSDVLHARIAVVAGSLSAAAESAAAAAAADPALPAARALEGDAARRAGDARRARAAYGAALTASPTHARSAFGLAKLALAGHGSAAEARAAAQRVLDDPATPPAERARAAIHLGALRLRAGDRAGAAAALDAAALGAEARAWAERAMAREASGSRQPLPAAPSTLRSPSDEG